MLTICASPQNNNEYHFHAVTGGSFNGKTLLVGNWDGSYPFQIFHSYADKLSYIYSNDIDRENVSFRISRYIEMFNSAQSASCLGRGLFVAHKLLFSKERIINLEETDTERTATLITYLLNGVAPGAHQYASVNSKISHGQNLFTQMILGLRILEVKSIATNSKMTIEKILKDQLLETCQVVVCVWDLNRGRHAALFVSSQQNNQHYLVDSNLPIVKFENKQSLIDWAPKIIRSMYSKTNEVSSGQLKKAGISDEFATHEKVEIVRTYAFEKTSTFIPGPHRFRELTEYSKAIWHLPFEKGTQNLEETLWKIKIQRLIFLVTYSIKHRDYFNPPLNLSPLTDHGVKELIIDALLTNPVSISLNGMQGTDVIIGLADRISHLKTEGSSHKSDFFNTVMKLLKDQFENLQS
jgi:hypothetical protein